MPLSSPVSRKPSHTRSIVYSSYRRDDGLWDIEARLTDSKGYLYNDFVRGHLAPGEFVHNIGARVTVDTALNVVSIETSMDDTPYSLCGGGSEGVEKLVGANLGAGWRKELGNALGGTSGCTHLREMLNGVATVGFQTIISETMRRVDKAGVADYQPPEKPFFIDGCYALSLERDVVGRFFPEFSPRTKTATE